jgi:hypothetical protein
MSSALDKPGGACCLVGRLAEKLRAARVNKERALQLQQKAKQAAEEAEHHMLYDKVLKGDRL